MIYDRIDNYREYLGLSKNLDEILELMKELDFSGFEPGRFSLLEGKVSGVFQSYTPADRTSKSFEAHRKNIDLQFVLAGEESVYVKHIADLSTVREYNEENDGELLEGDDDSYVVLKPGTFAVFFVQDGHKPGCKGPDGRDDSEVTKVVLKARI